MAWYDYFSKAGSLVGGIYEAAKEFTPYISAGAMVAGAIIPLLSSGDKIDAPKYQPPTTQDLQMKAQEKATQKRRELARRQGQQATIKTTPLGLAGGGFGVRTQGLRSV